MRAGKKDDVENVEDEKEDSEGSDGDAATSKTSKKKTDIFRRKGRKLGRKIVVTNKFKYVSVVERRQAEIKAKEERERMEKEKLAEETELYRWKGEINVVEEDEVAVNIQELLQHPAL